MKDFSTKNVVIIGATGGLGKAISISLAGRNANLYLLGRDENKLDEVKNEVKSYTGNIVCSSTIKRDANFNDWEKIGSTIEAEFGIPDIIINAIGVDVRKSIQDQDEAEIISQLDTNLKTPIYITKAFLPYFLKQNKGEIVHFSGFLDGRLAFPYYTLDVGESLESAIYYFVLHKKGPKIPPEDFIFSLYFIELNKEKNVPFYKQFPFNNNSFYFTLLHLIKTINYKLSYKSDTPKTKRFIPHDTMMRILKEQLGDLYNVQ